MGLVSVWSRAALTGLIIPIWSPRGLVQCCCGPTGEEGLVGAEQKGEDSGEDGDPNTCTWSPDSTPHPPLSNSETTTFDCGHMTRTVAPIDA